MKLLTAFAAVVLSTVWCGGCSAQTWNDQKSAAVRQAFSPLVGYSVISMAVSIAIDGQQVFAEGFGQAKPGIAADADTIYHIGSVTKQFTAAAILSLIDDQAVVRHDGSPFNLNSRLPLFFLDVDDRWNQLTVKRLLTMTSGLPNFTQLAPPQPLNSKGIVPAKAMLAAFKIFRQGAPIYNYSNTNYFLLGQILEVMASTSETAVAYHDYVKERIFSRAGMTATGFIGDQFDGELADPWYNLQATDFALPDWPKASGDIATSVNELHKWNTALLGGAIISEDRLREMFGCDIATMMPDYSSYCMGWFSLPTPSLIQYYHAGEIPGYHSINVIIRDRNNGHFVDISILTSSQRDPGLLQMATVIVNLLLSN